MIVTALGDAGAGKSRVIRTLTWKRLARWKDSSAIVHDPMSQWTGGKEYGDVDELRAELSRGSRPRLALVRQRGDAGALACCQVALEMRDTTLVLDELDYVCNRKKWRSEAAREVAHYGRHHGVDLFGAFRFTRNVNEDLPGLASVVLIFRHSDAALYDLRTLRERFVGLDIAEVESLPDHECLVWTKGRGALFGGGA